MSLMIIIIKLCQSNPSIVKEFPFTMRFKDKKAIDTGGVARDALSAFWEHAYLTMFDGGSLLIPAVHHKVNMKNFRYWARSYLTAIWLVDIFLSAFHFLSLPQAYLGHM